MSEPPPDDPPSPLVPVPDPVTGRVVAHLDPTTGRLRVKGWRQRRKWVRVWIDLRRLLDIQGEQR